MVETNDRRDIMKDVPGAAHVEVPDIPTGVHERAIDVARNLDSGAGTLTAIQGLQDARPTNAAVLASPGVYSAVHGTQADPLFDLANARSGSSHSFGEKRARVDDVHALAVRQIDLEIAREATKRARISAMTAMIDKGFDAEAVTALMNAV